MLLELLTRGLTRGLTFPTLLLLVLELLYLKFLVRPGPFRVDTLTRGDCGDDGRRLLRRNPSLLCSEFEFEFECSDGSRIVNIP